MTQPIYVIFAAGLFTALYLVAALFFLKFWRRSGDSLFAYFALAFALFAIQSALPALLQIPEETGASLYLLRLAGFAIIIAAILFKNFRR